MMLGKDIDRDKMHRFKERVTDLGWQVTEWEVKENECDERSSKIGENDQIRRKIAERVKLEESLREEIRKYIVDWCEWLKGNYNISDSLVHVRKYLCVEGKEAEMKVLGKTTIIIMLEVVANGDLIQPLT